MTSATGGRVRTRAPSEDEEAELQAQGQQPAADEPTSSMAGRPPGGRAVMPNANIRGDNYRRVHESGREVRSGIQRSSDETTRTRRSCPCVPVKRQTSRS